MEKNHKETALALFNSGFLCSQSVFAAYAEDCGITEEQALKTGACFGAGMRKGEVCGALTGALMVLGMLYGQSDKAHPKDREQANFVTNEMMERFADLCGSCRCNELLGYDISTPEGAAAAKADKLFIEFCPKMVEKAVDILEGIIAEQL